MLTGPLLAEVTPQTTQLLNLSRSQSGGELFLKFLYAHHAHLLNNTIEGTFFAIVAASFFCLSSAHLIPPPTHLLWGGLGDVNWVCLKAVVDVAFLGEC